MGLLRKFETARPFREQEAWLLFRIAAISEAGGWTLLILGLLTKRFIVHGNNAPVLIAGQLHGTIFLIYLIAALGLYPCLGWSRKRAVVALAASVPPYGTLLFEQWASHRRHVSAFKTYHRVAVYNTLLGLA